MITVDHLSKSYGGFVAVDDISFDCRAGTVTGFLGPNGAGKTTTMRIMIGLTPATSGTTTIGGYALRGHPQPRAPRGRPPRRLRPARRAHRPRDPDPRARARWGCPTSRVDEMLGLVSPRAQQESKRRLRNYSLGMRQRLGIAHALLGDPAVLILDEPANGLDPAGIRWMRGLLKGYADRGGTVLLSSHLLNEVELIADEMILIGRGRIVAQGDKKTLLSPEHGAAPCHLRGRQRRGRSGRPGARRASRSGGRRRPPRAAPAVDVGTVAADHGIVLTELRSGTAASRTSSSSSPSDTQRDALPAGAGTEEAPR